MILTIDQGTFVRLVNLSPLFFSPQVVKNRSVGPNSGGGGSIFSRW